MRQLYILLLCRIAYLCHFCTSKCLVAHEPLLNDVRYIPGPHRRSAKKHTCFFLTSVLQATRISCAWWHGHYRGCIHLEKQLSEVACHIKTKILPFRSHGFFKLSFQPFDLQYFCHTYNRHCAMPSWSLMNRATWPAKHETLNQCCVNDELTSKTAGQLWPNIVSMSSACLATHDRYMYDIVRFSVI